MIMMVVMTTIIMKAMIMSIGPKISHVGFSFPAVWICINSKPQSMLFLACQLTNNEGIL